MFLMASVCHSRNVWIAYYFPRTCQLDNKSCMLTYSKKLLSVFYNSVNLFLTLCFHFLRVLEASIAENKACLKRTPTEVWRDSRNPYDRKRQDKAPVGLKNVGNTCWFSAVIQVRVEIQLLISRPEEQCCVPGCFLHICSRSSGRIHECGIKWLDIRISQPFLSLITSVTFLSSVLYCRWVLAVQPKLA